MLVSSSQTASGFFCMTIQMSEKGGVIVQDKMEAPLINKG